jgi:hypothetical protein
LQLTVALCALLQADAIFNSITYADTNQRLGMRFLTASQTAGVTFTESETSGSGDSVFSEGPVSIGMATALKFNAAAEATCSDSELTDVVKPVGGYELVVTTSGTSCGYSSWFDAAMVTQLATGGVSKIGCTFGSFATTSQPANILWDPTVMTNETNSNLAFESANPGSDSSSSAFS